MKGTFVQAVFQTVSPHASFPGTALGDVLQQKGTAQQEKEERQRAAAGRGADGQRQEAPRSRANPAALADAARGGARASELWRRA